MILMLVGEIRVVLLFLSLMMLILRRLLEIVIIIMLVEKLLLLGLVKNHIIPELSILYMKLRKWSQVINHNLNNPKNQIMWHLYFFGLSYHFVLDLLFFIWQSNISLIVLDKVLINLLRKMEHNMDNLRKFLAMSVEKYNQMGR